MLLPVSYNCPANYKPLNPGSIIINVLIVTITNLYSTFEVEGNIEESRLGWIHERELWFEAADSSERVDDGSGHRLLHVAQHG